MNAKFPPALAIISAALLIVCVFLLLPGPQTTEPGVAPASPSDANPHASGQSAPVVSEGEAAELASVGHNASPAPPVVAWEDRLDELLTNNADTASTVRGLVSSMRGLPPEAQEEYVAHAVNLCEDDQYGIFNDVFFDPATPAGVKETIFNDVLNRPDEVKLPLLARTLQNSAHPMTGEAREILEMYLDLEPGSIPPVGWDQAVRNYLAEQAVP